MKNSFMWYLLKQLFSTMSTVLLTPFAIVALILLYPIVALLDEHEKVKRKQYDAERRAQECDNE